MHPPSALQLSDTTTRRGGIALLLIGLISLTQAAGIFPIGSSTYPDALALTAFGAACAMIELGKHKKVIQYVQVALMLSGIALVIIF